MALYFRKKITKVKKGDIFHFEIFEDMTLVSISRNAQWLKNNSASGDNKMILQISSKESIMQLVDIISSIINKKLYLYKNFNNENRSFYFEVK